MVASSSTDHDNDKRRQVASNSLLFLLVEFNFLVFNVVYPASFLWGREVVWAWVFLFFYLLFFAWVGGRVRWGQILDGQREHGLNRIQDERRLLWSFNESGLTDRDSVMVQRNGWCWGDDCLFYSILIIKSLLMLYP